MKKRHQVAAKLIQVDIILKLSAEQLVVQLIGIGQCGALDRIHSTQELTPLVMTRLIGLEAFVTPLIVVPMIAQRRGKRRRVS